MGKAWARTPDEMFEAIGQEGNGGMSHAALNADPAKHVVLEYEPYDKQNHADDRQPQPATDLGCKIPYLFEPLHMDGSDKPDERDIDLDQDCERGQERQAG